MASQASRDSATPADPGLGSRYRDVAVIGQGAFGRVYRAVDDRDRPVAVKVLSAELAGSPEVAWQFAGEFRALARLDHPAFPAAYDEGRTSAGLPYYAMALVDGEALPVGPVPATRVREVLGALSEALAYLHGLGLVHGDIKPDNVRQDRHGRYHLLDVGLMTIVGQPREQIAGTLEYLAPEAFRRQPIDPRADLYALGALAFQLWTGSPPFQGPPAALVRAHLTERPADPASRAPDADPALSSLITSLLAKEPVARPQTAQAVLATLEGGVLAPALALPGLQGGSLVGREPVLAAWNDLLDGLAGNQGQAAEPLLALEGELGSGKSRILDECRLAAQLAGVTWVGATGTGAADAPAAALRFVVAQAIAVAGHTPGEDLAAWLAGEVPARLAELEPASRKAALQAAATAALRQAARTLGGLAVGLDDWHLADPASRELLDQWARQLVREPIRWVMAYEPGAGVVPPAGEPLVLARLDETQARELLASRLGTDVPAGLAEDLVSAAQGSPLWLHALLEQAYGGGALVRQPAGWTYRATRHAAPGGGIRALWAARLAALDPDARQLAAVAAVASRAGELGAPLLAAAAGLDEARAHTAMDRLLAAGVLVERDGRARLAMSAAAPIVVECLAPEAQAEAALRLARDLLGGEPASLDASQLAALGADRLNKATWLALAAGTDLATLRLATEAARRALALAAPGEALQLIAAAAGALSGAPPEQELATLFVRAEAARLLDRLDDAALDYEACLTLSEQLEDAPREARVLVGLAKIRQMRGTYEQALALLERAGQAAARLGDAVLQARVAAAEGRVRLFQGDKDQALACCDRTLAITDAHPAPSYRSLALNLKGALLAQENPQEAPRALALIEEALALCERLGDRLGQGGVLENLGNVYLATGRLAEAMETFERAGAVFEEVGSATDSLGARLNQAIVAGDLGDLTRGARLADEVARRAATVGRKFFVAAARAVQGQVAWRAARGAEVRAPLDDALAIATEIKNRYLEGHVRGVRLEAYLALGDREAARQEAAALEGLVAATGDADAAARLGAMRAELARQQGDAGHARELAEGLLTALQPVAVHRARQVLALVALAAGNGEAALGHARLARDIAGRWRAPWHELADAWLEVRALGVMGDARGALSLARAELDEPSAMANPYARAGLTLALVEHDDGPQARAALETALAGLRPGLLAMDPAAWPAALEAQGLAAATGRLERRHEAPVGAGGPNQLDAGAYARAIGELALQPDERALGQAALQAAMELVGAERGYFLVYDDGTLREAITHGLDYESELQDGFSHSIAEDVLFSGEPLYVADASSNAAWREAQSVVALGLRTVVCLPVATPDQILGVLYMDRQAVDPVLSPADMAYLGGFTMAAAAMIRRERERLAAEAARIHAERLATLAAQLAQAPDPAAAWRQTLAALVAAAGAQRGYCLVTTPDGWDALAGVDGEGQPLTFQASGISQGIADWVRDHGEPLALLDAGAAEGWQARQSVQALRLRTVWCLNAGASRYIYLDTSRLAPGDPSTQLEGLAALVAFAVPLVDAVAARAGGSG